MGEAVLAEFKCPICINYISRPIRQCVQGHLFCNKCFAEITRCAICRGKKSDDRCLALEKLHALLTFPCRFRDDGDGCDYTGKPAELAAHETSCLSMECPLQLYGCLWKGKCLEVANHCRLEHEYSFFENERVVITNRCHVNYPNQIIISNFNTLFRCSWYIESRGKLKLSVYHIGNPSITEQFAFEFAIMTTNGENISMFPCYQAYQYSPFLLNDKYLLCVRDIDRELSEKMFNLEFRVKIHKVEFKNTRNG